MPTYSEIQTFVQRHHGFIPKPAWSNHVKVVWVWQRAKRRTEPGRVVVSSHWCPKSAKPSSRPFGISV